MSAVNAQSVVKDIMTVECIIPNMMYACIAVLRALCLHDWSRKPENIKEATKVKKVSNNESTLDDWLKGSEQDTNEDSITDELPDIDNVIDKDSNKGVILPAICTECKHVVYCSRNHQRNHWSSHQEECKSRPKNIISVM